MDLERVMNRAPAKRPALRRPASSIKRQRGRRGQDLLDIHDSESEIDGDYGGDIIPGGIDQLRLPLRLKGY